MTGTPNGISSTAAGCAPYYPVAAYGTTGYVCETTMTSGVFQAWADRAACYNLGFGFRQLGSGQGAGICVDQGEVVPGDIVWSSGLTNADPSTGVGAQICGASGLTLVTVNGTDQACGSGTRATSVSDAKTQSALGSLSGKVDAFASANHTDLGAVRTSITAAPSSSGSAGTTTGTSVAAAPAESFDVEPVLESLFLPVLFALLVALLWSFWKQVAR